jgi:hypothetical protein
LLRKEDKFNFFDNLKVLLLCGGLTWFFWSAHQNKKFELKLPKETMEAIQDVKEGKNVKEFNSTKELFKDLGI